VLDAELIDHLESDGTLIVGTVDRSGIPEATYAWTFEVREPTGPDDPTTVRLLVPTTAARTRANLEATGQVAATVTDVITLRSAQVKGRLVGFDDPSPADERRAARKFDAVMSRIHETDGTAMEVLANFRPRRLFGVVISVDEVYDQTPGPVAGTRLAPSAAP
jgi:hypothetical protein